MEIAGVDRLLNLARELGIDPARKQARSADERPSDSAIAARSDSDADDIRVSLSAAARAIEKATAPTPTAAATDEAVAPMSKPIESNDFRTSGSKRTGGAIAAYQRNSASPLGERLRVRA